MTIWKPDVAAPATAAALIAQQVAGNAIRDGLVLSLFPVKSLPYFMAGAAVLAIAAARLSGLLLDRFGPRRVVPVFLGSNAALFVVEWAMLGWKPPVAAVLLYLHSAVMGAIAISSYWSLLNERFDPHSAKPLMARVAAAATFGGLVGGVSAERVAALLPQGSLLPMLGVLGALSVVGALRRRTRRARPRAGRRRRRRTASEPLAQFRRQPLLRDLAAVIALAAMLAALVDYLLKAEAVAYFGPGQQLVRFFGLFYAGTALAAVLVQASFGRLALGRLGLGGSVASHPALVGAAALFGFVVPPPWSGILPRGLDVVVRSSTFRAGYELLYTPLAEATKRSVKSLIDVGCDCAGKGVGALLILLIVSLATSHPLAAVNVAVAVVAGGEFFVARRLRAGYVGALEGGLRRQGEDLAKTLESSMTDFTVVGTMTGLDRAAVLRAMGTPDAAPTTTAPADPAVAAIIEFRSGDLLRIRAALREPAAAIRSSSVRWCSCWREMASCARSPRRSRGFGARAAGEMVSVLLDPATPDVIRRRLPFALTSCPSPVARDGLWAALEEAVDVETRLRCGRALLALTDEHPELQKPFPEALALVEREIGSGGEQGPRAGSTSSTSWPWRWSGSPSGLPPAPSRPTTRTCAAPHSSISRPC